MPTIPTLLLYLWISAISLPQQGTLTLDITNIDTPKGSLRIAIFNSETTFLNDDQAVAGTVVAVRSTQPVQVKLSDMPFGKLAIAVHHDVNDNGKIDKNNFGIPIEPYAFSNNPSVKWRSPTFAEAQFEFKEPNKTLQVELKRWKKY